MRARDTFPVRTGDGERLRTEVNAAVGVVLRIDLNGLEKWCV